MLHAKYLIRTVATVCLAMLLAGCVIEPAWGPYHHHRYHDGY
jgi:hypothetical protein